MMPAEPCLMESVDPRGVATLTLDRAARHNALDENLIGALTEAVERLSSTPAVRLLVLAANGPSFCAGADLGAMQRAAALQPRENLANAAQLARLLRLLDRCPKPTVARVQGPAYGGGVGLVACCDIALGASGARFALSEVRLGLTPATISPYVIEAIGARQARRYVQSGETFDAAEARRIGLLHEVVEAEALDPALERITDALLRGAPTAQAEAKQLVVLCQGQTDPDALERETVGRLALRRQSAEAAEGLAAFLQKRPPDWRRG